MSFFGIQTTVDMFDCFVLWRVTLKSKDISQLQRDLFNRESILKEKVKRLKENKVSKVGFLTTSGEIHLRPIENVIVIGVLNYGSLCTDVNLMKLRLIRNTINNSSVNFDILRQPEL